MGQQPMAQEAPQETPEVQPEPQVCERDRVRRRVGGVALGVAEPQVCMWWVWVCGCGCGGWVGGWVDSTPVTTPSTENPIQSKQSKP